MKLIAIEEHVLTTEVDDAWRAAGLAARDPIVAYHHDARSRDVMRRLLDLADERIARMDETGVDVQVLSLTTPALHPLGAESVEIARRTNDAIAEVVFRHPQRFQAFATLPVTVPDAAAQELDRCVRELGFKGTMLCGRVGDRHLDEPAFMPIFQAAAELSAPVFLHPQSPPEAVRSAYYAGFTPAVEQAFATYGIGWHYDIGVQFIRLVLSGLLDKLPDLQLILGHWGELVLFYTERLAGLDRVSMLSRPFSDYLRRNLYLTASGLYLHNYLDRALEIVGSDRLLFSTDYPYQYRPGHEARHFVHECRLDDEARINFAHRNWERLTAQLPAGPRMGRA